MTYKNSLELARSGDSKAIAQLINDSLKVKGITAKVKRESRCLLVFLETPEQTNHSSLIGVLRRGILDLHCESIDVVKIYGSSGNESSAKWTKEVVLRTPALVTAPSKLSSQASNPAKKKLSVLTKFLEKNQQIAKDLMKTILIVFTNHRFRKYLLIFGVVLVLVVLGVPTTQFIHSRLSQNQVVAQAHSLSTSVPEAEQISDLETLRSSSQKLQQAVILLQGIQNYPGSLYSQAQGELKQVRPRLDVIEARLKQEEEYKLKWESAQQLTNKAMASIQTPPYAASIWQQAKSDLTQAITLLESIPPGNFVSSQVSAKLPIYKSSLSEVSESLDVETKAQNVLLSAEETAAEAMRLTKDLSYNSEDTLYNAQSTWQKAIGLLKSVSLKTAAYSNVADRMNAYERNYKAVSDGLNSLKQCRSSSADSYVTCESPSLDLVSPPSSQSDSQ